MFLQVQHLAISCIQKNVKKFTQIRDWDWWKLYIKVKPLLNVHRTEEELRDREVCNAIIVCAKRVGWLFWV